MTANHTTHPDHNPWACEITACQHPDCVALEAYHNNLSEPKDDCPEHGEQEVTDWSSTGGPDPYGVSHLACGHQVICLGPGDPNIIINSENLK